MTMSLHQAWYTPESWRQLEEAIAAAGMPKNMLCASYAEFVDAYNVYARGFEGRGVRVREDADRRPAHGGVVQALGFVDQQCRPDEIRSRAGGCGRRPREIGRGRLRRSDAGEH